MWNATPSSASEPTNAGRFITFEGIDGAGKSTHIAALADQLRSAGREVVLTREPGGTPLAEKLRQLLLNDPMDSMTEALLAFAARRDHLERVILPALQRGVDVLCDRFTDSTYAYQGGGRGFSRNVLAALESYVQEGRQPDLTLWFDLPPQLAAQRREAVRAADRFEAQDIAFFERVREGYSQRMRAQPQRFVCIDASRTPELVWQQICAEVPGRLDQLTAEVAVAAARAPTCRP